MFVSNIQAGILFKARILFFDAAFSLIVSCVLGMDSNGNDINNQLWGTNVVALMLNTIVNCPEDKSACVAGFNTKGWVKTKIDHKLTHFSNFPLDGLYVRIDFVGFKFYQGVDSLGGDITARVDLSNDIPSLISTS